MVIAVRGKTRIKVSRKSYEKIFKPKGFVVIQEEGVNTTPEGETEKVKEVETEEVEVTEEETENDIDSVPISEMNKQQLSEYAKKHNIDTSGATSVSQARKIIQREVRSRNMQ